MKKVVIKKCACCDAQLSIFNVDLISRKNGEAFVSYMSSALKECEFNGDISLFGNNEVITSIQYDYENVNEINRAKKLSNLIANKSWEFYCQQPNLSDIKFLEI